MSRIVETHPLYGYIRGSQFDADMDEGDVEQWSVGISEDSNVCKYFIGREFQVSCHFDPLSNSRPIVTS